MRAIIDNEELAEVLMRDRHSFEAKIPVVPLHTLLNPYIHLEPERFSRCPVFLVLPENDRWTDASLGRIPYDRLNCSKDMKPLKGAGHPLIEKEGLMRLEQYYMEFPEECLAQRLISNYRQGKLAGLPYGKSYQKMV